MKIKHYQPEEVIFAEKLTDWKFQDLEGQQFGRLIVMGFAGKIRGKCYWWCQCNNDGNITRVKATSLKSNMTKSCGCYQLEIATKHGMEHTVEYDAYSGAIARCNNPNHKKYPNYGGRGIEFRFDSFEDFYAELGEKPEPKRKYSLERINNDGHYERGNVKWTTSMKQNRNRRDNHLITFQNKTQCMTEWAIEIGMRLVTLKSRLEDGWCEPCTLTIPPQKKYPRLTCLHR